MQKFIERDPLAFNKIRFLDIYLSGHNGFIAGGVFKNIFQGVKIKDIDIFFRNEMEFSSAHIYFKDNEDYIFSYENPNTVAFKNKKTNVRVELIRKSYGTPEEILTIFDFSITKFAVYREKVKNEAGEESTTSKCLHHEYFFEHLTCKKLVLEEKIIFPVSTFERSYRYTKYGFGLCKESKGYLINAIKEVEVVNLSNELYFGID